MPPTPPKSDDSLQNYARDPLENTYDEASEKQNLIKTNQTEIQESSISTKDSKSNTANLDYSAVLGPVHYIESMPSKSIRSKLIDALNIWFELPDTTLSTIKATINDVHNSTLILDDIQDSSPLRRAFAAAHTVFGASQCVNSATYMVVRAASTINAYQDQNAQIMQIFFEGLEALSIGQSWDLEWRTTGHCPSTSEYMAMVDGKTGAMFRLAIQLMHGLSTGSNAALGNILDSGIAETLGRYYQIRDDYQNLQDGVYTSQKGFCEDLDEGKLSYPFTVCCERDSDTRKILMGIFRQKSAGKPLPRTVKLQILEMFRRAGAFQQTWEVLDGLQRDIEIAVSELEASIGALIPNYGLS